MAVPALPVELYSAILALVPASKHDPSERTLLHCLAANSVLRAAALAPAVWRTPYRVRYTHADAARERERRAAAGDDWRVLYVQRRAADRAALGLVDAMRTARAGRNALARRIVQEYGFDVWDALREEAALPVPGWVRGERGGEAPRDALPRRYWAKVVMGVVARREVVEVWGRAAVPEQEEVDFEHALAGLSAFFDVSVQEVLEELEDICTICRENLVDKGVVLDPKEPDYNFWHVCEEIREAVQDLGFTAAEGHFFYKVMNQFPHSFLKPGYRSTIPMSQVYVFVAVARRLGIQAAPANFPGVVQVHLQPPDGSAAKLLDMRGTAPPIAPSASPYVQLWPQGAVAPAEYSRAAAPGAMLTRASNNIQAFIQQEMAAREPLAPDVPDSAFYAASCWVALAGEGGGHVFPAPPDSKPLDYAAVLLDGLCPQLPAALRQAAVAHYEGIVEDEETRAQSVKLRSRYSNVDYFVGLPFLHARYGYLGVIYGWDPTCMASEHWIQSMSVDLLPHGRHQPFYHVIPADGHPRYVAQENIDPVRTHLWPDLYDSHPLFSRYFVGVVYNEAAKLCRLVVSKELQDAYPEDDAYAAEWLRNIN